MYNSLKEYIEEQISKERHVKRLKDKLYLIVLKDHDKEEIIELISIMVKNEIDIREDKRDYLYAYIANANKIDSVIFMHFINMQKRKSKPVDFLFYEKVVSNKYGLYTEEEIEFLTSVYLK